MTLLRLVHLFPTLLGTYGDRGNVMARRARARIAVELLRHDGRLRAGVTDGGVVFAVCAGLQVVGNAFSSASGTVAGLELLDVVTVSGQTRAVGEIVVDAGPLGLLSSPCSPAIPAWRTTYSNLRSVEPSTRSTIRTQTPSISSDFEQPTTSVPTSDGRDERPR